jgi:protein SCO1/2
VQSLSKKLLIKLTLAGIGLCFLVIGGSFFIDPLKIAPKDPSQRYNPSGNFTLTGTNGNPFQLQDLRGKIVLLFFGYTSCPDACPMTLAKLQRAFNMLDPGQIEQVRTLFISVDPERDNPELLKDYVDYFGVNAIGLTGTKAEIDKVVQDYEAHYLKIPSETDSWYTINHTTTVYLHDKQGKVRYLFLDKDSPEQLAEAIREHL